jgi:hypothetical protein
MFRTFQAENTACIKKVHFLALRPYLEGLYEECYYSNKKIALYLAFKNYVE